MKVIDLLNIIANSELIPDRIKYNGNIYYYDLDLEWYIREDLKNELFIDRCHLRDNVEIIEEPQEHKIPEKWQHWYNPKAIEDFKLARFNSNDMKEICQTIGFLMEHTNTIKTKLDEIIDYLEENK